MTGTNQTNCAPNTLISIANSINLNKKKLELGNSNNPYQNKPNNDNRETLCQNDSKIHCKIK